MGTGLTIDDKRKNGGFGLVDVGHPAVAKWTNRRTSYFTRPQRTART